MTSPSETTLHGRIVLEAHIERLEERLAALENRLAAFERRIYDVMEAAGGEAA
jgi:hypothetical protein